ncbi:MAG: Mrp/NBP35 family ATP-binding protein [Planctomycetes bacterium]|nr:Mrp/NBP35 family ATP-binding protein [Planctomycetota bacterium]
MTDAEIRSKLGQLTDPELEISFDRLGLIRSAQSTSDAIKIEVQLPTPAYPKRERLGDLITSALAGSAGGRRVDVTYSWQVVGRETGGKIGLRIKNVVAVGSGKGGVGKSTTAASLAYGLKHFGAKVGLLDADVYGPSIPLLTGAKGTPIVREVELANGQKIQRLEPIDADGMKVLSIGFLIRENQAVIWRGPMLHKLLTQFLQETDWGELDYLIIDLPPGTGDVSLTLSQLLGLAGAVVVCTPQKVALLDAIKAISMFDQVKIPVLGIVENMSGDIFGRGGAKAKALELGLPFLGEIPIDATIRVRGDDGQIASLFEDNNPVKSHLLRMTENIALQIAKRVIVDAPMPSLEIL